MNIWNFSEINRVEYPKVTIVVPPNVVNFELVCFLEVFKLAVPNMKNKVSFVQLSQSDSSIADLYQLPFYKSFEYFSNKQWLFIPNVEESKLDIPAKLITLIKAKKIKLIAVGNSIESLVSSGLVSGSDLTLDDIRWSEKYPQIKWQNLPFVADRDSGVYTSRSGIAMLQLTFKWLQDLNLYNQDFESIARLFYGHDYHTIFSQNYQVSKFDETIYWAESNIRHIKCVEDLANKACLSRRSFDRKFKAKKGLTPKEWLTKLRIEKAQHLLEQSEFNIEEIADITGFGSGGNMRNSFQIECGVSPSNFRHDSKSKV
jgi:AraC family transcriptional activator FtrA